MFMTRSIGSRFFAKPLNGFFAAAISALVLYACPHMMAVSAANEYEISFIRFDGNRGRRSVRDHPCDISHAYQNVLLSGSGFHARYVESYGAVCGSGMVVGSANTFEIYGSLFYRYVFGIAPITPGYARNLVDLVLRPKG